LQGHSDAWRRGPQRSEDMRRHAGVAGPLIMEEANSAMRHMCQADGRHT
jgi:hypothetical protein